MNRYLGPVLLSVTVIAAVHILAPGSDISTYDVEGDLEITVTELGVNQQSERFSFDETKPDAIGQANPVTGLSSFEYDSSALNEDSYSEENSSNDLDKGLEFFDFLASLPGAYDLAWDIRTALELDPSVIDFESITLGPEQNFELKHNYLEYMIKDPDLRAKWVALMEILSNIET